MSCKRPLVRAEKLGEWKKAADGHLYHPYKVFSSNQLESFDRNTGYENFTLIPCNNCINCRLDSSRQWANRGFLQNKISTNNYFVTLTYDDYHLPKKPEITTKAGYTFTEEEYAQNLGCLNRPDVDKFLHDLRRELAKKGHTGMKYMLAGEYGTIGKRPHYHLILFDCPLPIESFYEPRIIRQEYYYQNHIIEKCWQKGISNISEVSWNTIAYVARYITKKMNGEGSEEDYALRGQIKEFFSASNQPGIGRLYYEQNKEEIYRNDEILIINKKGTHHVKPPKYFDRLMTKEDPERMRYIKAQRKSTTKKSQKVKDTLTSLSRWEQNQIELATKEITSMALKREL